MAESVVFGQQLWPFISPSQMNEGEREGEEPRGEELKAIEDQQQMQGGELEVEVEVSPLTASKMTVAPEGRGDLQPQLQKEDDDMKDDRSSKPPSKPPSELPLSDRESAADEPLLPTLSKTTIIPGGVFSKTISKTIALPGAAHDVASPQGGARK